MMKAGRVIALTGRVSSHMKDLFRTNHFNYVTYISIVVVFLGAFGIYFVEGKTFGALYGKKGMGWVIPVVAPFNIVLIKQSANATVHYCCLNAISFISFFTFFE
ncbi:hypothetical protein SDC9_120072 [bioreactor metagenome]|uniref:Uncharacterized protein n=1 Tax=bioreactor metagenome TaxID=1076179 RepID=A0A645C5L5_9ZZZZ